MGYTADQVALLQGEVIDQSNVVFDTMSQLAASSTEQAQTADLDVDFSGMPLKPEYADVVLTDSNLSVALGYIDTLRRLLGLYNSPAYPSAGDYAETTYSSTLLTALVNLLYDNLINGGYGINTDDEENLWNRAREREIRAMQSQQDSATRQFAVAGFPMPTGAAQKAMQQLQQEASEKIAAANRDIAIKRADMYVENRKFTITASTEVEKTRMGLLNSKMDRLLERYKIDTNKIVEDYKARAAVYAAIAGAYTSLWSSNSGLAQAQASLAIGEINAQVAVYRAEMDQVLEKAKIELDSKKTAAGIYMALATAAMSAMNVNTSMSAGASAGQSVSTSYNHSYDENA